MSADSDLQLALWSLLPAIGGPKVFFSEVVDAKTR